MRVCPAVLLRGSQALAPQDDGLLFQIHRFKQPRVIVLAPQSRELIPSLCPQKYEGHGAPRGAPCNCFASGTACEAMLLPKAHRLAALHSRRFWARGPCFRMGRANPDPADFAAFISIPCSRNRQSHVVGPDGDPSLPDATGANRARRRRILLRFKAPSRSAPHEQDVTNIRAVQSAGIAVPITKCFGTIPCPAGVFAAAVIPGLAKWRMPE
jgi:hypothetical protein